MVYRKVSCHLGDLKSPEGRVGIVQPGEIDDDALILILGLWLILSIQCYPSNAIYIMDLWIILPNITQNGQVA